MCAAVPPLVIVSESNDCALWIQAKERTPKANQCFGFAIFWTRAARGILSGNSGWLCIISSGSRS